MNKRPLTPEEFFANPIRSRVMYKGDFEKDLKATIGAFQALLEKEYVKKWKISSLSWSNYSVKIWIDDDENFIHRIIECVFRYDVRTKRYGYTNIEFDSHEVSKKPRLYFVGKFAIKDSATINTAIIKEIEKSLEEIY